MLKPVDDKVQTTNNNPTQMDPFYRENFGEPCREVRKRFIERVKKLRAKSSQANQ